MPVITGPHDVTVARETAADGELTLHTSHDGYVRRFGIVHHRILRIAPDGNRIEGEDVFLPPDNRLLPPDAEDAFALRFHLHPAVRATRLTDGHGVMLLLPNKDVWNFTAPEDLVELEESVFLGGLEGPRRTVQIVIAGQAAKVGRVHWTLAHTPQPGTGGTNGTGGASPTRQRGTEPELPL